MKRRCIKSNLLARLERLETKVPAVGPVLFQYGWINRMPADFEGERHVVVVKRQPTANPNVEWCEFEQRPGLLPPNSVNSNFAVYLTPETPRFPI